MTVPPGPADAAPEITAWLHAAAAGDSAAEEQLLRALYDDLHRLARKRIRAERRDHTLQPTGLVHEAYVRLMRGANIDWNDRAHFFAAASTAMRRVLVDHARRRTATKRGSGVAAVELGEVAGEWQHSPERVLAVDQALEALALVDRRQARIVELRFFSGFSEEEVGELLGISTRTVKREWKSAKDWLYERLKSPL